MKRQQLIFNTNIIDKKALLSDNKVMRFFENLFVKNTSLRKFLYEGYGRVQTISEYNDKFDFYYSFLNMSNINIIEDWKKTLVVTGDVTKGIKSAPQKYRDEYNIRKGSLNSELKSIFQNFGYGKTINENELFTLFYMKEIGVLDPKYYFHINLTHDHNEKEVNCVFFDSTLYITVLYPSCMMTVLLEHFKPDKIVIILTDSVRFREKSRFFKIPEIEFCDKTMSFNIDCSLISPMVSAIRLKLNK